MRPKQRIGQIATIRDRLAAQILDLTTCTLLFWSIGVAVSHRYSGIGLSAQGLEIHGRPAIVAGFIFAVGTFIYFFISEAIFGATVGKLLCRLRVQSEGNAKCGFASALVRNVLRPVDVLPGLILMATSVNRQTLGDRVAGTTVLKFDISNCKEDTKQRAAADDLQPAGWEARTKAAVLDLTLLTLLAVAYLFATGSVVISGQLQLNLRGISLLVLIDLLFLYFIVLEGVLGGTVGKLACKLRVVRLDGQPGGFVESTTRAVSRLIDICTAGILPFLLVRYTRSRRNLGDRLAETVVVNSGSMDNVALWSAAAALFTIGGLGSYPFLSQTATRVWAEMIHRF